MSGPRIIFMPWWPKNPYHDLLAGHLTDLGAVVRGTGNAVALPLTAARTRADIVHLHAPYRAALAYNAPKAALKLAVFLVGLAILRLAGVKLVWTVHDLGNHENRYPGLDRICTICVARLCHAILVHCDSAGQTVVRSLPPKGQDKVYTVPHGNYVGYYENEIGRAEAREALGIPEEEFVVLFFGLIRAYKGVPDLVDAFGRLRREAGNRARLLIVGRMPNEELAGVIKAQVAGRDDVELVVGLIEDDDIQTYMNASDAVVFPYRKVLTSGAVLLAMSFGKACIAPRLGCIGDVLDDSGAFLYDLDEEDGLRHAMERAIRCRDDLPRLGARNRKMVEPWGWDRIAGMTFDIYRKCLGR